MMLQMLTSLYDYDRWANRRTSASVENLGQSDETSLRLLAHLLSSKRMWLGRIKGDSEATPIDTWPTLSLAECERLLRKMEEAYQELMDKVSEEDLDRMCDYQTAEGSPARQCLRDILVHGVLHSAYHRGQIATAVREAGGTPARTDFVVMRAEQHGHD